MAGFSGFVASWYLMFLLGSLFGKFMEDTGAADTTQSIIRIREKTCGFCGGFSMCRVDVWRRKRLYCRLFCIPNGAELI